MELEPLALRRATSSRCIGELRHLKEASQFSALSTKRLIADEPIHAWPGACRRPSAGRSSANQRSPQASVIRSGFRRILQETWCVSHVLTRLDRLATEAAAAWIHDACPASALSGTASPVYAASQGLSPVRRPPRTQSLAYDRISGRSRRRRATRRDPCCLAGATAASYRRTPLATRRLRSLASEFP